MDGTVVVTGAAGGLGKATARAFADAGATVVAGDRDRDDLEAIVEEVRASGGDATAVRADARDEFDLERLLEVAARTATSAGDDDVAAVVPCASVHHGDPGGGGDAGAGGDSGDHAESDDRGDPGEGGGTPLADESYSAYDDTLRTNARGVFAAVREAVPHLAPDGRVVVPTGSAAREDEDGCHGAYAVSLAAVEAVARGFAADLDRAVGCVEVGDGPALLGDDEVADAADLLVWAAGLPADRLDGRTLSAADREAGQSAGRSAEQ